MEYEIEPLKHQFRRMLLLQQAPLCRVLTKEKPSYEMEARSTSSRRLNRFHEAVFAAFDLQNRDRLIAVAVFVDRQIAGDGGQILRRRDGVANRGAVDGTARLMASATKYAAS
jgi:hypothetical protein